MSLPTTSSKFTSQWKGPFDIVGVVPNSNVNYIVDVDGIHKTYHVDMMQEFVIRPDILVPRTVGIQDCGKLPTSNAIDKCLSASEEVLNGATSSTLLNSFEPCILDSGFEPPVPACSVGIIHEDLDPVDPGFTNDFSSIVLPSLVQKETAFDVKVSPDLSVKQKSEIKSVLTEFYNVFSDVPDITSCITHDIKLSSEEPIKLKPYPLPFTSEGLVRDEVSSMLELDVIEPSESPYCSPIVLVKKKDGSVRFCIDFRALNLLTVGDACPIPDHDLIMSKMADAIFFTKLDMTKGYWQIAISEESRKYTAFQASGELFQFKRMAFGLKNAPMTYNRMMNRLIGHREDAVFFFDDVTIFHINWDDHLLALYEIFKIFQDNNLRIKPSKTAIGYHEIDFLGHKIVSGLLNPYKKMSIRY